MIPQSHSRNSVVNYMHCASTCDRICDCNLVTWLQYNLSDSNKMENCFGFLVHVKCPEYHEVQNFTFFEGIEQ